MKLDVSGRHFRVTEALKDYAVEKLQKLDKYSLKLESAHIVFEVQKFTHISEIVLRGKDLRLTAKATSLDMHSAFDKSFGGIQLQLRKKHERARDHKGRRYDAPGSKTKAKRARAKA
jgi:putative sigma-54 modulation protein